MSGRVFSVETAVLLALTLPFLLIGAAALINRARARRQIPVRDLMPNRLMPRRKLVFLSPLQSPFYFSRPWNDWPALLAEHGYEVHLLSLPWADHWRRREALFRWWPELSRSHILADPATAAEVRRCLGDEPVSLLTIKALSCEFPLSFADRFLFAFHRAWCRWRRSDLPAPVLIRPSQTRDELLERLQDLAEKDWTSFETHADIEA